MRARFGRRMYKVALDGGFTCPTRDGTLGTRGCVFCSGRGSGDFTFAGEDLVRQLEYGAALIAHKNRGGGIIAYFQSFTGTYAPAEELRRRYGPVFRHPLTDVLSIATRPDCLPDETVALLAEMNREKPVWVELGLQTIHPASAAYIRRGYDLPAYDDAVRRLKAAGLEVIAHTILGLPGETPEDMAATAQYVGSSGADGVKLQLLHVLKGTDLAEDYAAGRFEAMTPEAYFNAVSLCLEHLPPRVTIHRMTGDGAKADLIAPLWSADKKRVWNALQTHLRLHDVRQGSALTGSEN
ncbi:MAG: TIGR01212 family radical SAM protein [Oscillospiraceae bacterium]|nr:TIGR01212 family radical SAM protein [Oscillospiraceae bacterium]